MISACFITKNEEKWLGDCLEHLRGFVDEVVVLDTGSTDRTIEIAKGLGARVFEASWPGSFSAARNMSLQYARHPWILRIDPDERISIEDQQKLLHLCAETQAEALEVTTRGYTNSPDAIHDNEYRGCVGEFANFEKGFKGYNQFTYVRLFRRLPHIHFVGDVHEDVRTTCKSVDLHPEIIFHHYGWDDAEVARKDKRSHYERLMLEEIQKRPHDYFIYYSLANLYLKDKNFERAEKILKQAVDHSSAEAPQAEIYSNWGLTLLKLRRFDEAETALNEALNLNKRLPAAWVNWGSLKLEQHKASEAIRGFKQAIALDPKNPLSWRLLGQAAAMSQDPVLAEKSFREALQIAPHYEDAALDLAILYDHCGIRPQARKLVNECLERNPTSEAALGLRERWSQ